MREWSADKPSIPIGHDVPFVHSAMYATKPPDINPADHPGERGLWFMPWGGWIGIWSHTPGTQEDGKYFLWAHERDEWFSGEIITWAGTNDMWSGDYWGAYGAIYVTDLQKTIDYIIEHYGDRYENGLWRFDVNEDFSVCEIREMEDALREDAKTLFAVSDGWAGFHHGDNGGEWLILYDLNVDKKA